VPSTQCKIRSNGKLSFAIGEDGDERLFNAVKNSLTDKKSFNNIVTDCNANVESFYTKKFEELRVTNPID
jgi:hypothetical protein